MLDVTNITGNNGDVNTVFAVIVAGIAEPGPESRIT
jgi:hypothetical protein